MSKVTKIGIIAEDETDYEAIKILIKRIINNDKIGFKKKISNGCGKMKHDAFNYAVNLKMQACDLLILFHDLDKNNLEDLERVLNEKLHGNPIKNYFICIPIEEIEAWFLSDPECIKSALNLKKVPKIKALPETIVSPKEELMRLVDVYSDKEKVFLTKHNAILAANISIDLMYKKCTSLKKLHDFLKKQKY